MAVFMINICKFNGCGITFPSLGDLIQHIEDTHIDYDPLVVEQKEASQPSCIPLSYVLRFFTEASRRELASLPPAEGRRRLLSAPKTPSLRSSTPTGSDLDDEEMMSPSEDSNDSWTTVEEYSSEFILRYGVKSNGQPSSSALSHAAKEKPFACPVPGCKKRYKNVNGIKYHSKNGHKKDGKVKKAFKCHCGKSYKTAQGLKGHSGSHHLGVMSAPLAAQQAALDAKPAPAPVSAAAGLPAKTPGLVVTASNSYQGRALNILDGLDGNKLVRIYDSIKPKDLPSFTIPRTNLNILKDGHPTSVARGAAVLTPGTTPGSSPVDKFKYRSDRSPKVMVQSGHPPTTPLTPPNSNEQFYVTKKHMH